MIGLGLDAVDVARFRRTMQRHPRISGRLFTDYERAYGDRFADPVPHLAARFAAKEAVMKALGVGLGAFSFHDIEVLRPEYGAPELRVLGAAAALAARRGVGSWRVSLTHTELVAQAVVIASGQRCER